MQWGLESSLWDTEGWSDGVNEEVVASRSSVLRQLCPEQRTASES